MHAHACTRTHARAHTHQTLTQTQMILFVPFCAYNFSCTPFRFLDNSQRRRSCRPKSLSSQIGGTQGHASWLTLVCRCVGVCVRALSNDVFNILHKQAPSAFHCLHRPYVPNLPNLRFFTPRLHFLLSFFLNFTFVNHPIILHSCRPLVPKQQSGCSPG